MSFLPLYDDLEIQEAIKQFNKHTWTLTHSFQNNLASIVSTYYYKCDVCDFAFSCCNIVSTEMFYKWLPSVMVPCGEYLMRQIL